MSLRRFCHRLKALVTRRRIYTTTFEADTAFLYAKLLAIHPAAAANFAHAHGLNVKPPPES